MKIQKLLVANRGEIACRIFETCHGLGIATVAVYSDADARAKHVREADEAIHIGPSPAPESYLKVEAILAAAKATGADAIHPGYGFLSENADFAEAVEKAGLIWVGPSAKAIRSMGPKDEAKRIAEEAGVPVLPGYRGEGQELETLARAAKDVGFPLLIKAVAGGGGRGIRLVSKAGELKAELESAVREAESSFGDGRVMLEKLVEQPRHIEVQVFGDGKKAVHLFERDCSLQRRHQKVIEEAPAPGMTPEMREAMGQAAVTAAEAIGYAGAGTIEFIVDGSGGLQTDGFFFMEMNTRLQVEHPVTEAITGVDLVAWQLRVAAGEGLPLRQDELSIHGHAFEARLYAEDVPKGFLPATGTLTHLQFTPACRADSGVRAGDTISPFYDPMIAKVIVHGDTREIALSRLRAALTGCEVAGTVTNLAFLGALAAHEGFAAGDVDTGLIARDIDDLTQAPEVEPRHAALAGMAALSLLDPAEGAGFTLWQPLRRAVGLTWGGEDHLLQVQVVSADHQIWTVDGTEVVAQRIGGRWSVGGQQAAAVSVAEGRVTVFDGYGLVFDVIDPLARAAGGHGDGNLIEAPMPGLVRVVDAKVGQTVTKGDRLAVLEAMKMEHSLLAARDGVVAEVLAQAGDQVEAGVALVRLEPEA